MLAIRISGKDRRQTADYVDAMGEYCRDILAAGSALHGRVKVMGPIEAPLARIANHHRWQLLASSPDTAVLHRFAHELILSDRAVPVSRQIRVSVDVDPFFMM
jgi:primosomal protein N' (replication factor Y)